jgi:predicted RNase H-related nuclease YkuK (DUF458 family)
MKYKNRFKKFGGDYIPDIIEYLKDYIEKDPNITITVGCDSIQKRRKTIYAITIMLYNGDVKNGAHVVFFRDSLDKVRDNQERLYKEALYLNEVGTYLNDELSNFYSRSDLNDLENKKYKYHLLKCSGEYSYVEPHQEEGVIKNLTITASDIMDFKLVDLHVDFNPVEGSINEKGMSKNRSYTAYKSYVPWLRGMGFRTWAKNVAYAASSAADLLLKD